MSISSLIVSGLKAGAKHILTKDITEPAVELVDQNIKDITTTVGSFIVRSVRGKFQRSISFTIGVDYSDYWMEEALYGILYQYNKIKKSTRLELKNQGNVADGSAMYYRLDDGTHNLKYRNYDILLVIQSSSTPVTGNRIRNQKMYTIITYDLSPEFVIQFEKDMLAHRNSLLKIKADAPTLNVYTDYHESDGWTYWEKQLTIHKRRIGTVYLPYETKKTIVDTVNRFFSNKKMYNERGIAHNLKILLYGPPGPQPVSVMIPTPKGFMKFGDIRPNDEVFDVNGNPTVVQEVYAYKDLDVYEVEFEDGRTVHCADTHKFMLINQRLGSSVEKKYRYSLRDILGESESYVAGQSRDKYFVSIADIQPDFIKNTTLDWDDCEIFNERYGIDDNILVNEKYLCEWVDRMDVLRMLMADYTNTSRNMIIMQDSGDPFMFHFYVASKACADQLVYIARSVGYLANVSLDENPKVRNSISMSYNVSVWTNGDRLYIKSIKKLDRKEDMHCLHIAHDSHQYITEGFVPTCNTGKDTIAKMIASEWNRNVYYVTGGKDGKFIPNAITDDSKEVNYPLMIISDIDKYPFLISEPDINIDDPSAKEERLKQKQLFGSMINALDGVMSAEDRIIIMTTNHYEKFSETFLRDGRVDLALCIDYVTPEVMRKYVYDNYHVELPENIKLTDDKITVARLQTDTLFKQLSKEEFIKKYISNFEL